MSNHSIVVADMHLVDIRHYEFRISKVYVMFWIQAKALTLELYRWLGAAALKNTLAELKPVQVFLSYF
jgi:hypothetical protein